MTRSKSFVFTSSSTGRVDVVSSAHIPRSVFSRKDTVISVNGVPAKKSHKVKDGDDVKIDYTEDFFDSANAEDIKLDVIYEDDDILVINKPSGMVVHPAPGNYEHTLVSALLFRYGDDFSQEPEDGDDDNAMRPGIVHRLDKDTSGVMVVAKNLNAHNGLASQFKEHTCKKTYIAFVKGEFVKLRGTIDKNIVRDKANRKKFTVTDKMGEGRSAITRYEVLKAFKGHTLLKVNIETGRTHQIRVHMLSIGHPVIGDAIYSRGNLGTGLLLHSSTLELTHPRSGERMTFSAPIPERFISFEKSLGC